jgi:hypothetical protein
MNPKLRELLQRTGSWPQPVQDEALDYLLAIDAELRESVSLTDEDREALEQSAEDVRQGRFATDDEIQEVFNRYRNDKDRR